MYSVCGSDKNMSMSIYLVQNTKQLNGDFLCLKFKFYSILIHSKCLKYNLKRRRMFTAITFMRILKINISRKMASMSGIVTNTIRTKLQTLLEAKHLDIINESYMHNVPKGAETHFKVVVVSDKFDGLPLIKRHRLVNDILKEELQSGVHALSIVAKTPQQWETSDKVVESSPNCRGGFGK